MYTIISTHNAREQIIGSKLSKYVRIEKETYDRVITGVKRIAGDVWQAELGETDMNKQEGRRDSTS